MRLFQRYELCMALSDRPWGPVSLASRVPPTGLNIQANQAGPLPALLILAAATEAQVLNPEQNSAVPLSVAIPNSTAAEQTVIELYASGYIKTTATGTVTIKLYEGNSATIGSNTLLGSSGAVTQNSATESWFVHATLIYNSVSQTLSGKIEFYVNRTAVAAVTLSNFPATINNADDPVATFTLTATSSGATGGTLTTVNVQKFSVG